jgi:hypothetical protein
MFGLPFGIDLHGMLASLLQQLIQDGHSAFAQMVDKYILGTGDFIGHGPLIKDPAVSQLYGATAKVAGILTVGVLVYGSLRGMTERSFRARYTLKALLPKVMVVVLLIQFGLPLIGGAMALNLAAGHAFWSATTSPTANRCEASLAAPDAGVLPLGLPPELQARAGEQTDHVWCALTRLDFSGNLILGFLLLLVTVMLIVLALVGVVRNVVLAVLTVCAPIAFLCLLLPETRAYTTAWRRAFLVTVFCQAVQVLTLRLALVLTFNDSAVSALHGLVAMYLVLKVPSALHGASAAESKVLSYAKHLEHGLARAIDHSMPHTPVRRRAVA